MSRTLNTHVLCTEKKKGSIRNQRASFYFIVLQLSLNWLVASVSSSKGEMGHQQAHLGHVQAGRNLGRGPKELQKASSVVFVDPFVIFQYTLIIHVTRELSKWHSNAEMEKHYIFYFAKQGHFQMPPNRYLVSQFHVYCNNPLFPCTDNMISNKGFLQVD